MRVYDVESCRYTTLVMRPMMSLGVVLKGRILWLVCISVGVQFYWKVEGYYC